MEQQLKRALKFISIIIFAVTFVSCVTTQNLTIEIPQPGSKELPANIRSLTIVNRTMDDQYQNLESDSLQNIFFRKQFNLDTTIYDLQAVDTTMKALGELLFESGRYDYVIPVDRFLDFRKNSFLSYEMSWEEVKNLCKTYNTDAVLSMDYYKTTLETDYGRETFYDPVSDNYFEASAAQMQINYEVMFRVYDPEQEKVIMREFLRDTLIWEDADINARQLFGHFTPVKQALTEAGIAIALDLSDKISTQWRSERRTYFSSGPDELEHGASLAKNGEWEAAVAVWQELENSSDSKSIKSKAQFNIAVAYEILGDIDQAVAWAVKSYETMFRSQTYTYLETLQKRKNELKKLKP
ncbi:hypothetical protein GM418_24395 [Maribellus comscasis]|uniref:Tetratricopeptide repeat protein n=1 Tax=Maribellus comscasis TaxID=2681766 RepID=A0A6I6K9C7_9BACT|nr:DUF6340 family protein [Maribellus comscasis]QGY46684.1 hypothetical protein GM418_24395 [Maribellus comscasis]